MTPVALLTVLLVDDHEPFRRLISTVLEQTAQVQIIGQASDGLAALQLAEELHPDLIILDIELPKLNGIQAARKILETRPDSKIILLSQESSTDMADAAFRLGALGYVVKMNAGIDLPKAIQLLRQGTNRSQDINQG